MAVVYIKKAIKTPQTGTDETRKIVTDMLAKIEHEGEAAALAYGQNLDGYEGAAIVTAEMIEHAAKTVSDQLKDDIKFAYDRVTKFAEAQKASISDFETEISPGLWAGQKSIPIETAGCYVPGGRYAHVASAIMSIATAKVAGVENVIACSAPNGKGGPHPAILYAMNMCGADRIVSQAEHGPDSPAWLITTSRQLAEDVMAQMDRHIDALPEVAKHAATLAWRDYGEVILCDSDEEAATISDEYAAEHLEVHTAKDEWYTARLKNYGSLFIGEETTVTYGDKCSGTNHILPTKGAAHYTGGLSVHKFMKIVTTQRMTREANREVGQAAARISRLEGMEGHARAADVRLRKYFPGENLG